MSKKPAPLPLFPVEPPSDFDASKLATVHASGSAWTPAKTDPATVPIPLPVILAEVVGKYTERDRKLWRFLIHAVWDELETTRLHRISISRIANVFAAAGGDKNSAWIMESARRLAQTRIEYKIRCGDPRFDVSKEEAGEGFAVFLSAAKSTEMGYLIFEIPAMLIDIIKKPMRFARLRTHFIIGLSGKHAVTLYEILEAFVNKKDPSFIVSVVEFRQWLNLKPTEYDRFNNLRLRIIDPAIKQINDNPEGAGFSVEMQTIKKGRDVTNLRFILTKTEQRTTADSALKLVSQVREKKAANPNFPQLKEETRVQAKQDFPRVDILQCEKDWLDMWEKRGKIHLARPDIAFLRYVPKWAKLRDVA